MPTLQLEQILRDIAEIVFVLLKFCKHMHISQTSNIAIVLGNWVSAVVRDVRLG